MFIKFASGVWCLFTIWYVSTYKVYALYRARQYLMPRRKDCFAVSSGTPLPAHQRGGLGMQYRANREKSTQHKILPHHFRLTDSSAVFIWAELRLDAPNAAACCCLRQRCWLNGLETILVAKKQIILEKSVTPEHERTRQRKRKAFSSTEETLVLKDAWKHKI